MTAAQSYPLLKHVPAALEAMEASGGKIAFERGEFKLPVGGHLQGIQASYDRAGKRELLYISHDSLTLAYLALVSFPSAGDTAFNSPGALQHVQVLPSDGQSPPLRHAGGMQLAENVLAVGVEDNQAKLRSQIQFWDVANPANLRQLTHLTISRASQTPKLATAGAVALLQRENDFVLAVGNWDCRAIDFYTSNGKPLADPDCRFNPLFSWFADTAVTDGWQPDAIADTYQSLNFVRDTSGSVYLLGFNTTTAGDDVIDLFQIDLDHAPKRALRKLARKRVSLTGENHFRYGGGAIVRNGKLLVLSSERNFKPMGETRLNVLD